jgi:hypothetical protein
MTNEEKAAAVPQLIRTFEGMRAYEIVRAAEGLQLTQGLLAAEGTIWALAEQVKLRRIASTAKDEAKVADRMPSDIPEELKIHEPAARVLSTAWLAYTRGLAFDTAAKRQPAASIERFWYELADLVERVMAAPQ